MPRGNRPEVEGLGRYNDAGVLILTSLSTGPKHGYALMRDIEAFADTRLAPGTLYGTLDRLEGRGLVARLPAEERRHPYALSDAGRAALRTYAESLAQVSHELVLRLAPAGA